MRAVASVPKPREINGAVCRGDGEIEHSPPRTLWFRQGAGLCAPSPTMPMNQAFCTRIWYFDFREDASPIANQRKAWGWVFRLLNCCTPSGETRSAKVDFRGSQDQCTSDYASGGLAVEVGGFVRLHRSRNGIQVQGRRRKRNRCALQRTLALQYSAASVFVVSRKNSSDCNYRTANAEHHEDDRRLCFTRL